jgi:nicotinate-nucleotide--dimethylbenzimidazole phosphoribosyltransferase
VEAAVSQVIDHVVAAIGRASAAHGELAARRVGAIGGPVAALAIRLAGAQHAVRLRAARRALVVVAADHGIAAPGVDFGADHPTSVALRALAAGEGAIAGLARAAGATVVTVDAGCAGAGLPPTAVQVGLPPSADFTAGPGLAVADIERGVEAGIALAVALADDGIDVIGVGRLGLGGDDAATALIARAAHGLDDLAAVGGGDLAVLAGVILGAASMTIPVVLDGTATLAAAIVAQALAPAVADSLVASQHGSGSSRIALAALGLEPVIAGGIGDGAGAGAAMVLSLIPAAAALLEATPDG